MLNINAARTETYSELESYFLYGGKYGANRIIREGEWGRFRVKYCARSRHFDKTGIGVSFFYFSYWFAILSFLSVMCNMVPNVLLSACLLHWSRRRKFLYYIPFFFCFSWQQLVLRSLLPSSADRSSPPQLHSWLSGHPRRADQPVHNNCHTTAQVRSYVTRHLCIL